MSEIGSDPWVARLDERVRALGPTADEVVVQHHLLGTQERWYWVALGTTPGAATGRRDDAAVTLTQSVETATAIAAGELSPEEAFITGRIRLGGDAGALVAAGDTLRQVAAALREP